MATNKPKRKTYSDEFKEFLVQEAISSVMYAEQNGEKYLVN